MTTPGIDAGRLNRFVQIQMQSTIRDANGQAIASWHTVLQCRASIDIQNTQLIYQVAEFAKQAYYRITIRFPHNVVLTPDMRIVYFNPVETVTHTYQIEAIVNDKAANRQLMLVCYEINGDG
jgi:SPP1 family predicted phage head-tail adaptor